MMRSWKLVCVVAISAVWMGCNSESSTGTSSQSAGAEAEKETAAAVPADGASSQPAESAIAVALPVNARSTPHEVVLAFLDAMRDGNGRVTAALLTSQAQEETVKHDWPVQPPGAPTATYQLGKARYADPGETAVFVPCVWTESSDQNSQTRFEVEWRLHRQQDGWRVAGFASEIVLGKGAYYFNFEDIANLKQTQAAVETALAEFDAAQQSQAPVAQRKNAESTLR